MDADVASLRMTGFEHGLILKTRPGGPAPPSIRSNMAEKLAHFGVCHGSGKVKHCRNMSATPARPPHVEEELSLPLFFTTVVLSLAGLYGLPCPFPPTRVWLVPAAAAAPHVPPP